MFNYTIYDAFTGISPFEKLGVIKFLESNSNQTKADLHLSVDYAVKDCPSFGGYILSVNHEKLPIGVAVINKTGVPSAACKNILVQFAIEPAFQTAEFITHFFEKLIELTNEDLSLQLDAGDPNTQLLESLGFRARKIEYRFESRPKQIQPEPIKKKKQKEEKLSRKERRKRKTKLRVAV